MVLVVFGIIAVHQFGGKGYSCNDGAILDRAFCVGWWISPDDGILRQRVWSQPFSNFDNLGLVGLFTYCQLLTGCISCMQVNATRICLPWKPIWSVWPAIAICMTWFVSQCGTLLMQIVKCIAGLTWRFRRSHLHNYGIQASSCAQKRGWKHLCLLDMLRSSPTFAVTLCGLQAMLTLLGVTTLDNWTDVLFAASDITGANTQPSLNASPGNTIFLMVFVSVSAFWVMRVFIGIFTDQVSHAYFLMRHCRNCARKQFKQFFLELIDLLQHRCEVPFKATSQLRPFLSNFLCAVWLHHGGQHHDREAEALCTASSDCHQNEAWSCSSATALENRGELLP